MHSAWNSRYNSKGHVGIPLISTEFIDGIPMMARLLKDLGMNIEGLNKSDANLTYNLMSSFQGLFFVEDAAQQVDSKGRKIIAAQDFVKEYDVKSVFGFGGRLYRGDNYVVVVLFTSELLTIDNVNIFLTLNSTIKQKLQVFLADEKLF